VSTPLPAWAPEEWPDGPAPARLDALVELAGRLEPLSLPELGAATLMDRVDTKFLLPFPAVAPFVESLRGQYRVLDVNGTRLSRYGTRYFDTPELALYHAHQAGRLPRYKVRIRSYLDSREHYLEVKLKNNKGRTLKTRTLLAAGEGPVERVRREARFQMNGSVPASELIEILTAGFTRLTLVRADEPERITIDVGLTFTRGAETRAFPGAAIVELKQERHGQADARDALRGLYMREGAVSKYCIGVATLEPRAKKNRFKRVLSSLERIERGSILSR
jgi:hypothetical protein